MSLCAFVLRWLANTYEFNIRVRAYHSVEDINFRDKYTNSGLIGRLLVDRFFASVRILLHKVEIPIANVLEVGVGEGFSTQRIRTIIDPAATLEASEFDAQLTTVANQRNPGIVVKQESVYNLQRSDDSFDLVVCLEVLEHLENPSLALKELARVSRGFVIVSVPREPIWKLLNMLRGKYLGELGNTPGHIQHWSSRSMRRFVSPWFDVAAVRRPVPWTILLLRSK